MGVAFSQPLEPEGCATAPAGVRFSQSAPRPGAHAGGARLVTGGATGRQGPAGAALAYVHQQPTPATTWIVNHNFGTRPAVTVLSPGGVEMDAEIIHASANQVLVAFNQPCAGSARCI